MPEAFTSSSDIRSAFSAAMSAMYRKEVPAYGTLIDIVNDINSATLSADPALKEQLDATETLERITEERHGAIRVGSPEELSMIRRIFAVMGMFPVGYYDLSEAGVPVHSTAFRPVDGEALKRNPFRVFTSLLRLDLIADETLREEARDILKNRRIFTDEAVRLTEKAERLGGLDAADAEHFITEVLETFRWHSHANVTADLYRRLHDAHRLIADVVSFRGPHINHLTPRTLDIDAVQAEMPRRGISPKAVIEGPPTRRCPILLRQTSFKALEEPVIFAGASQTGSHTARFGEIEARGAALTPKGRALYDTLLASLRGKIQPAHDGSNAAAYMQALQQAFAPFPDTWEDMRDQGLAFFTYSLTEMGRAASASGSGDLEDWIAAGFVRFDPIVYEDFLPVSAAGIFQSNLGEAAGQTFAVSPNKQMFERDLGANVVSEFDDYAAQQQTSIDRCRARRLRLEAAE